MREVGSQVSTPGVRTHQIRLVTTRLDAARYRVDDLAARYWTGWEAAMPRGQLQPTRHRDVLHGKTVAGVRKDLTVLAILAHLVRLIILPWAHRQRVDAARISILDALRWLGAPSPGMP